MLHHAQRQLLSRCSLRYYSVSAVSGDAVAASGTSGSPRTRRPSASSFGGISIARSAMSGWGDGLVTFSFSNPIRAARPLLMPGPRTTSMTTRSPTSRLNNNHAAAKVPIHDRSFRRQRGPRTDQRRRHPAVRAARLTALSSTNLDALFRTRDAPVAGTPLPVYASMTARVRSVLERSAGDYSRFLPRTVGVRKSASSPPVLRTARHALAAQRDVSLAQRRVALHIIGGLAEPGRQVSA
ncbi:hypothetical protein EDB83DRAFT_2367667 [Lactarius deliciosus]|nr:hypothetical protein EDB83DRAFT_2367667 [Lactarius deliciosus]